ncbi:MAG: dihydrolipoyl dehydrogenase [Thermoplasmata archaeon]
MKEYDVIAIGTGSVMHIIDGMIQRDPETKAAVIDKDEAGGICMTRGCIPSKILLYSAEVVRTIQRADVFGIDAKIEKVDFAQVMGRMRSITDADIERIEMALTHSENIDYYHDEARFVAPYTMGVAGETIHSELILLGAGSEPTIPPIDGLEDIGYLTSDTFLHITELPESVAVVGGGYIAAEYGHFLAAMGAEVTILGRNPQFLPKEEPEISALAKQELEKHMTILTNHEVRSVREEGGLKHLVAFDRESEEERTIRAHEILVAAGRGPTAYRLHPDEAGIETDSRGWIVVDEHLQTSQPNIYALGDATGHLQFKHKANYEATVVYYNAVLEHEVHPDYHAVPHAVFTYPEVAGVGLREREAIDEIGEDKVAIGVYLYRDTAKGEAMGIEEDLFAKIILERETYRILGAHIIGPHASILIQEVVSLMYTEEGSALPIINGMHIHPALSEVVERALWSFFTPGEYRHMLHERYDFIVE